MITFFKGFHYCIPFPFPWLIFGKTMEKKNWVKFNESIRYELPGEDQHDVNKLFGFSCGLHHVNSDRIGFRYSPEKDMVELVLYSYFDETRIPTQSICFVNINETVYVSLKTELEEGCRTVTAIVTRENGESKEIKLIKRKCNWSWFKYSLGGYFGGNRTAPHKIKIKITRC